jgi:hypothetical protein
MRGEPNTLFVQDEIKHGTKANVFITHHISNSPYDSSVV